MLKAMAVAATLVAVSVADADDAVVGVLAPVRVTIPSDKPSVTKRVRVRAINGNSSGDHTIALSAASIDCPAGTIAQQPDFVPGEPGVQGTITLGARRVRQAVAMLEVGTDFTTFNRKTPNRCTLVFTASSMTLGNVDPTPDNNVAYLELNVFDRSDPEQTAVHETIVDSYRVRHPGKIDLSRGTSRKTDTVRVTVINGDAGESSGDLITLTADDGDCPPATFGTPDFDRHTPGEQNTVVVRGQRQARGRLTISVDGADFFSPSRQALGRCTGLLTVSGPGGDSDASNNVTRVPVGVLDRGDLE